MSKGKVKKHYQTFLVGGAVRDQLLGYPFTEKDWVVVGATPDQLKQQGFQPVGKDFPVFLHPETKEEYALARTERKTGKGYHGFDTRFDESVTLEEDLSRRDLTINAIAMTEAGTIIDPYHGQKDLANKIIRHVSDAFLEDPLRLLRVARFMARYHQLGFTVADETLQMMRDIVASDELLELTPERVWLETEKALSEISPHIYFSVLRDTGALAQLFPEIDTLYGIPNPVQWHPEIDTGIHTMMVLEQAALISESTEIRFAALCHDLGKGLTPEDQWPKHRGHEKAGVKLVKALAKRYKIPNRFMELACLASEYHLHSHRAFELRPDTILKMLKAFDFFRRPERFTQFLDVCEADFRGRTGFEEKDYPQRRYFEAIAKACEQITIDQNYLLELPPKKRGQHIDTVRTNTIREVKQHYLSSAQE